MRENKNKDTWNLPVNFKTGGYPETWEKIFEQEINKGYFRDIEKQIEEQINTYGTHFRILPDEQLVFNAFNHCKLNNLKVCWVLQDCYINIKKTNTNQELPEANGIALSVPEGVPIPPSLRNVYKELKSDIYNGKEFNNLNGDLTRWCEQGVLMLNSTLTVTQGESNSHSQFGWQKFTDEIIKYISDNTNNTVFILLGNFAKKKSKLVDKNKHYIITGVHPSPLSASRGFFGSKIFSKCNEYLINNNKEPINW